jgi:hypothetical protein
VDERFKLEESSFSAFVLLGSLEVADHFSCLFLLCLIDPEGFKRLSLDFTVVVVVDLVNDLALGILGSDVIGKAPKGALD